MPLSRFEADLVTIKINDEPFNTNFLIDDGQVIAAEWNSESCVLRYYTQQNIVFEISFTAMNDPGKVGYQCFLALLEAKTERREFELSYHTRSRKNAKS